ncbi:MAG: CDP-diacylglycerol--glycerol-3-phosphate 3-phosphatidyltransferase [Nitrospiraceae bacterium]|nr:CDP-diacylglycerol--glycerol-3-phosphate 3-phosphatidyltransferase [Nitrospiraceae bacterium]MDA8326951.1 CDP-diacylglycerol--glycerol-3-phosphate 3-phosphatidyltransferase [Nitrospiraceae bacterium]
MKSSTPTLRFNLPTVLTLSRVFVIPVFLIVTPDYPHVGAFVFTLASLTDWLDGYLARKTGAVTKFGILMDPIADKFLVISALVLLVNLARISVWIAAVLIVREFLVTALRVVALSKGMIIPAEMGGKVKTVFQFIAIVSLVLGGSLLGIDLYDLGTVLIWVALALSVFSGVKYTMSFWRQTA